MDCCEPKINPHSPKHGTKNHEHENNHAGCGGHNSPGMNHGSAKDFLKRFWIVTALLVPLALANQTIAKFLRLPQYAEGKWVQFAFATIIFGLSLIFFKHAWHEIKMRKYGMMTLVSLAVGSGYLFSVASTFIQSLNTEFYLEISTLIWVLMFGHYLEARSSAAAGNAIAETAKLLPKKAHKISEGSETDVDVTELMPGDIVLVKPGEKVPADGNIIEGSSHMNESHISGESEPVKKDKNSKVLAGSIALDGSITVKLTNVGESSTVGQIQKLIETAMRTKPNSQKIADKASAVLTFAAGLIALSTIVVWSYLLGMPLSFSITLAITVLVIACPHALGLAIPTVTTIATSLAVKNGIFIKNLAKIETIKKTDYVIFDKTGTLTEGNFGVTDIIPLAGRKEEEILKIAASVEKHSSHIISQSIIARARKTNITTETVTNFKNTAGRGNTADLEGRTYLIGNKKFMEEQAVSIDESAEQAEKSLSGSKNIVFLSDGKRVIGLFALTDKIKPESFSAVRALHSEGIKISMITGDNKTVAENVAKELGIDSFFAEVLPKDKYKYVKDLQDKGNTVLMVGDGVNDAPALTQSDAGIAIGAGTDIAIEAGDVILTRNNPEDVAKLITLSRKVYNKMTQNLAWALGYNIIAIPAAAGAFAKWGFYLRPEVGALLMSASTVIVVLNALTLKRIKLNAAK